MRAETVGRVLGIGLRVAGRMAGQRMGARPSASAPAPGPPAAPPRTGSYAVDRAVPPSSANLIRGLGGLLRPFRRVGGTLWLEVTGVFFLLPVVVFTPTLWRTRASALGGPDHRTFVAAAGVVAVFLYLGVSSFWRARRRSRVSSAPK